MIKIKTVRGVMLDKFPQVSEVYFITDNIKRVTVGFFMLNRMVFMSVAWCAPQDVFSRSVGRSIVAERLVKSEGIFLPLGDLGLTQIVQTLVAKFELVVTE